MENKALGCAFTSNILFSTFNIDKIKYTSKQVKSIVGYAFSKREFAARIFKDSVKLIINDIINNNINFELPTPSGQLHLVPIQGEDFKKARQNGAFRDVDYLKSNFTGYEMKLDIKTKYPRSIPVHLDSKLKNKIVEQTNKGIQYA